ncbi:putative sulfate exporter family transporter [Phyllobacterium sp. 0TCS1.6C]|uniref:YeiH family protein n=1 Tax=unclassified Phyllobacterium TaxID=2638441 RepID=UPI0022641315|nr:MULTISPECIES: putative sulfate exporter family transporter [unclassified Phyllobacterium]MCX8281471.1 putative sulfate exporter family transporter [Phyllobacterium sp. 0TCS1.6C]MCX8292933.1 putative sulfate exporter family transporter [Phyllobacterium sp. 0TCS1.6A]
MTYSSGTMHNEIPSCKNLINCLPGTALSFGVAAAAFVATKAEFALAGAVWLGGPILAIALGLVVAQALAPGGRFEAGIMFSSKTLLEVAIVLLGASISLQALQGAGLALVAGITLAVFVSIGVSYVIGRWMGLAPRLATLIACGNSICGNSAIVAVAPVIKAGREEIAAALAFTAVLGIATVFLLPLLYAYAGMGASKYGVLAGMTVYAVPQVLAAAAPAGALSVQIGTLVKLVRVLMLGPVLMVLGTISRDAGARRSAPVLPWFIVGFGLMMAMQSMGLLPDAVQRPVADAAEALTLVAMAALGLSVNIRTIAHAGGRVIAAATLSLGALAAIGYLLILALRIS